MINSKARAEGAIANAAKSLTRLQSSLLEELSSVFGCMGLSRNEIGREIFTSYHSMKAGIAKRTQNKR
jgi:hypothetical protein